MRALVVYAHPCPDSLTAHLRLRVVTGLQAGGHEPLVVDLYADPEGRPPPEVEGVVWVYPTWWSGPPAVVLDWMERVWTPGDWREVGAMAVVTTHGSPRWVNRLEGELGRRMILRGLAAGCGRWCRRLWLALYDLDRSSPRRITRFADRVERAMSRL